MKIERLVDPGLAQHSYYVSQGGESLVVDPRRDVDVYLERARQRGDRIRYVLETHRNEDYVVGSPALRDATGAQFLHSRRTPFGYGEGGSDGDECGIGKLRLRALETPGHTWDSLTWVLIDTRSAPAPLLAFTGDTLFVGDTGRTDLLGERERPRLSNALYDSLFERLLPLGDHVLLCAGHGGGSVCGGAILERDESSLGYERAFNRALQQREREAFARMKLDEKHLKAPNMETRIEPWNTSGEYPSVLRPPGTEPLDVGAFMERMEDDAVVVDTRMPQAFAGGHVPRSLSIWSGGVAAYLGWVVPTGRQVLLVGEKDDDVAAVVRTLLRIGWDEYAGHLRGGFEAWQNAGRPIATLPTVDTDGVRAQLRNERALVLDVRKPDEWEEGSVPDSLQIFVGHLESRMDEVPRDRPLVVMCSVGHRASVAVSLLKRAGFERVSNYLGGFTAWQRSGEKGA
jgi:hydroxyacylglutathione hydrolase